MGSLSAPLMFWKTEIENEIKKIFSFSRFSCLTGASELVKFNFREQGWFLLKQRVMKMIELIEIIPSTPENTEARVSGTVRAIRVSETGEITSSDFPNAEIVREKIKEIVEILHHRGDPYSGAELIFCGVEIEGGFHLANKCQFKNPNRTNPEGAAKFIRQNDYELTVKLGYFDNSEYVWCSGWYTNIFDIVEMVNNFGDYSTPDIWRKSNNAEMRAWLRYQELPTGRSLGFGYGPFDKLGTKSRLYQPGAFRNVSELGKMILDKRNDAELTFFWFQKPVDGLRRCVFKMDDFIGFYDNIGPIPENDKFVNRVRSLLEEYGSDITFLYYHDENGEYRVFDDSLSEENGHKYPKTPEILFSVFKEIGDVVASQTYRHGDEIINKFPVNDFFVKVTN